MMKLLADRFLIGMALGFLIGFSLGLNSFGSFVSVLQYCVVGTMIGGCIGLLIPKKALLWVLEIIGKSIDVTSRI
jgi:hypothetical protein